MKDIANRKNSLSNESECCDINEVVTAYYKELKGYLINQTKDVALAGELVQEIMLKAAVAHQNGTDVKNIRAWFYQVARTTLADHFRQVKKDAKILSAIATNYSIVDEPNKELEELVQRYMDPMLAMLPDKYAIPLKLAELDRLSHKQIAQQLGLSLSATKSRILRARARLLELIYECCIVELDKLGNFIGCTLKSSCKPLSEL
ncbi:MULTISPECIES: sigma-70 family RNA polymerase sigma factor [Olivibacter]|jgi:RNA polymerase sigma-70 factor (ECF subfamily)|uniref:Sigma-70 family RNA polymerase sigma factor n=1 Tax=Olivibacter jilunii TaxID=985016 RepID=A0ABW6B3M2_9SPHI|nr:sigma-70 family RNA polymerase sigma factor [Pseudosphingobacterium sp.]